MKLISLELENFRQHRNTSIAFPDGVTGIIGPNGAGKTTILEAIAWALYGAPAVRGKNENIRSIVSEPSARVSAVLTFELGGHIYKITRSLEASGRGGQAVLEADGKALRSGMSEVSEAVTSILGMDYRAFFTSFFTGQKQLEFMAALDGRGREAAISRMLGYDRLTKAREQANQDRLGLEREIQGLEKGLPDPYELAQRAAAAQESLKAASAALSEAILRHQQVADKVGKLAPIKEELDQKAKRYEELTRRLEMDNSDLQRAKQRMGQLRQELDDLDAKKRELESILPDLRRYEEAGAEYKKLKDLQVYEAERQQLSGQINAINTEIRRIQSRLSELVGVQEEERKLSEAIAETEKQLSSLEEQLRLLREEHVARKHTLSAQIEQLEKQNADIQFRRSQIAQSGRQGVCPTCERPLGDELETVLGRFDAQIEDTNRRISALTAELEGLSSYQLNIADLAKERDRLARQLEDLRKEKSRADAKLSEFQTLARDAQLKKSQLDNLLKRLDSLPKGFDQARFQELQKIGEELRPVRERAIALRAALDREPSIRREEESVAAQVDELQTRIVELEGSIEALGFSTEEHESLSREFQEAVESLNSAAVEVERRKGEVNGARLVLQNVEREQCDYEDRMQELRLKRREHAHLRVLTEAFDRLRTELNNGIRPELEYIASELLSVMTDGRYNVLRISEDYKPVVVDDGEEKPVISGGEDDIVNLALRLAISQMIADRAGQLFSLLILDEVFGSLDETRRHNVVGLLQNLKNRFEQIILITHIESIHDAVDNCLWVEFDEETKTSRVVERRVEDLVEAVV